MSTFHGLEMAKQALFTQQTALYTTGHNIANSNTKGYTRQRVNFETQGAYPSPGLNRPQMPGQIGTGVKAGTIERIRDKFLDQQYRTEHTKAGYWQTTSEALGRMESILNEPSDSGLAKTFDKFWDSLQDLANNPDNSGARSVVARRGQAVADTFNYLSNSLTAAKKDLANQEDVTVEKANTLIDQIHEINEQIKRLEPHGYLPNDLYDRRNVLVDELAEIVPIQVDYEKSSNSSPDIAEGLVKITLADSGENGGTVLLDDKNGEMNKFKSSHAADGAEEGLDPTKLKDKNGSLNALVHAQEEYTDMLANLDNMAKTFVEEFNKVHNDGYDINGEQEGEGNFFTGDSAATIKISDAILKDPGQIRASAGATGEGTKLDGKNALALASIFEKTIEKDTDPGSENPLQGTSILGFYRSLIGDLGVQAQEANRMTDNTNALRAQIDSQRESVSSVSLDEEISNLVKFQHAYNAAARSMNAIDEMLDKIINGMGLVGR